VKKTYLWIWGLCILGSLSVLPYIYAPGIVGPELTLWQLVLFTALQGAFIYGIVVGLSYVIVPRTDLQPFHVEDVVKSVLFPGLIGGAAVGVGISILEGIFFTGTQLEVVRPSMWVGLLASLFGAINEEVLLRLFFFSLLYLLICKLVRFEPRHRKFVLWIVTFLVALFFGLGHLPAAFRLGASSGYEVGRILFLNGVAGVVFGWLYWSRNFWAAVLAHFVADLLIHVIIN